MVALSIRSDSRGSGLRSRGVLASCLPLDHGTQPEILGPDVVLPEQLEEPWRPADGSPERALMLAILEDAIGCFQKYSHSTHTRPRRLARDAEQWIRLNDWSWPCSFNSVCDALGLDPEHMRSALLRMKPDPPTAEQHPQPDVVAPDLDKVDQLVR